MKRMQTATGVKAVAGILAFGIWMVRPGEVVAHCDSLDGPVVLEAKAALVSGDVTPILKWVKEEHEAEVRIAFEKCVAVRSMGAEPAELADMYLFETLVRLHREGEGAPYTGLKHAGGIEPIVAAADEAIDAGGVDDLAERIGQAAEHGVRERFESLMEAREHEDESVEAGRAYVEAYVEFVHFVEALHDAVARGLEHH